MRSISADLQYKSILMTYLLYSSASLKYVTIEAV